ncbi:MAG: DUF4097 family beta strand repeat-containing protein [Thermoanaerobaculia bacterium]|nr:DUF4097 family beta strand repeat-containing protein [Thermoanaerobaculia bacterium]
MLLVLPGLVGVGAAPLAAETVSDRWERTYRLPTPGGEIVVVNPDGDVTVDVHQGSEVVVVADRTARAESRERARRLLRDLELRVHETSKGLEIRVPPPRSGGWLDWIGRDGQVATDLKLSLPSGPFDLRVKSDNGDLAVRFSGRSAVLESTNGEIVIRGVGSSRTEANALNGGILLDLASMPESARVDLTAVNGDVRVVAPEDLQASIDARTVNGCVGTSFDLAEGHRTRSKLIGVVNGGGGQIRVRSTNGQVWVKKD